MHLTDRKHVEMTSKMMMTIDINHNNNLDYYHGISISSVIKHCVKVHEVKFLNEGEISQKALHAAET